MVTFLELHPPVATPTSMMAIIEEIVANVWNPLHKHFMSSWLKYCDSFYYSFSYKDKIRSQFCTCHDIWAAMACAKLWHDWICFLHIRAHLFLQDLVYKPINSLWYGSLALTNSKSRWGEGLKAKWCNFKYHTKLCQILSGHFKKFSLH